MNSSKVIGALIIVLTAVLLVSLMPREAKATTFYKYKWTYNWTFMAEFNMMISTQDLENDAIKAANNAASEQFATQMAKSNHWYRAADPSSVCKATDFMPLQLATYEANFTGTTTLYFDSDIEQSDYSGWGSQAPAGLSAGTSTRIYSLLIVPAHPAVIQDLLIAILYGILAIVVTTPHWVFYVLAVLTGIGILAWYLHSIGGVAGLIAPGLAGELLTAMILIVIIIALIPSAPAIIERLFSLGKRAGKKVGRKVVRKGREVLK